MAAISRYLLRGGDDAGLIGSSAVSTTGSSLMALVAYTPGPIPEAPMPACWNSSDLASILIYKKSNDDVVISKEFKKKEAIWKLT